MLTSLSLTVYWTLLGNITPASSHPDVGAGAPSWHQYVRAPSSTIVSPKAVVSQYTKDGVVDPENLITGRGTSLQRSNNVSQIPTVVLDFGQNVVGQLEIDFNGSVSYASQGLPGLKLSFSETLEFLTNRSDFTRSDNGEGVRQSL